MLHWAFPWSAPLLPKGAAVAKCHRVEALLMRASESKSVPYPPRHPLGLLLACILGWQAISMTSRDCPFVPLWCRAQCTWQWAWDDTF